MSTRDIQRHLQQVYRVEVSPETISNITSTVLANVLDWQNRPLEKLYPHRWFKLKTWFKGLRLSGLGPECLLGFIATCHRIYQVKVFFYLN